MDKFPDAFKTLSNEDAAKRHPWFLLRGRKNFTPGCPINNDRLFDRPRVWAVFEPLQFLGPAQNTDLVLAFFVLLSGFPEERRLERSPGEARRAERGEVEADALLETGRRRLGLGICIGSPEELKRAKVCRPYPTE